jgi:hypothetical protein
MTTTYFSVAMVASWRTALSRGELEVARKIISSSSRVIWPAMSHGTDERTAREVLTVVLFNGIKSVQSIQCSVFGAVNSVFGAVQCSAVSTRKFKFPQSVQQISNPVSAIQFSSVTVVNGNIAGETQGRPGQLLLMLQVQVPKCVLR